MQTPVFELEVKHGAVMVEDRGWRMPAHFGRPDVEHTHALDHAVVIDTSHRGKIEVAGTDAVGFLHNLSTNEIKQLPPGAGCEAFLTTGQAKIMSHLFIYRMAPQTVGLDVVPGSAPRVAEHLERFHITEQLEIINRTPEFAQFHLAGPDAENVLRRCGFDASACGQEHQHVEVPVAGTASRVRKHALLGVSGYDILCPAAAGSILWQALADTGARPAGLHVYNTLRIEAGMPEYGIDIDESNLPQEVGRIERTVSFTKGCYIGQETVARIRTYGHVNRLLVGLRLVERHDVPGGAPVYRDATEVGRVTSAVVSPRLGTGIALAYIRRGSNEPGTELAVETATGRVSAVVGALPFVGMKN
jgi:folate-binding protein YgfZ